jgi:hypothetical protein
MGSASTVADTQNRLIELEKRVQREAALGHAGRNLHKLAVSWTCDAARLAKQLQRQRGSWVPLWPPRWRPGTFKLNLWRLRRKAIRP